MKLPEEAVKEFQALYKEKYNKDISYEEAEKEGSDLLTLYALAAGFKIESL